MTKRRVRILVWGTLVVLTTAFIWGQSTLDQTDSLAESDAVGGWLSTLLGTVLSEEFRTVWLRKFAHLAEYGLLGIEWEFLRRELEPRRFRRWPVAAIGVATAVIDEMVLQRLSRRGSLWSDVLIDSVGLAAGLAVAAGIGFWLTRRRAARNKE